jgi:enterochelin esterase-like enzyme
LRGFLFFVNELVPYVDSLYRTIISADKKLVLGDSRVSISRSKLLLEFPESSILAATASGY